MSSSNNGQNFSKIHDRHQPVEQGSSEVMKQDKYQRIVKIIFKLLENKDKQIGNLEKSQRGKSTLLTEEQAYVL